MARRAGSSLSAFDPYRQKDSFMTSVWLSPELKAIRAGRMPRSLAGGGLSSLWSDAPMEKYVLRRSGMRVLSFTGMLLLEHVNQVEDESKRCHAVRLYETTNGIFIVEISLASADGSVLVHSRTEEVNSLAEAEAVLNEYDPSSQAALSLTVDDDIDTFSMATMVERVRDDAERLKRDFETARLAVFSAARNENTDTFQRVS
jgi:predicted hotdog family 3-hydroxylacyl-ACP dehydratase